MCVRRPYSVRHRVKSPEVFSPERYNDVDTDECLTVLLVSPKVGTLGDGTFGSVYKVRNRMDRRLYAIKAAKREARGRSDRERMLREVYALAALSDDASSSSGSSSDSAEAMRHVVRYYQAWMEGNRLYIQIELCQCTLLDEMGRGALAAGREGGGRRRYKLLREMCLALNLIHKSGMIHLDIKVG